MRPAAPTLDEIGATIAQNGRWLARRLADCDAAAWSTPTRCAPWTVGDIAAHLVDGAVVAHRILLAALEGTAARTPPDFRGDPASTVTAFRKAMNDLVDVMTLVGPDLLEREVVLDRVSAVTVRHLIDAIATEFAIHGLDLADALGETRHLTPSDIRLVASALPDLLANGVTPRPDTTYLLRSLVFEIGFTWYDGEWHSEVGPDPCTVDGEPEAVMLYALGRLPCEPPRLSTNHRERARAFKRYLPGP